MADEGPLVIYSIICAEVSATYATVEEVDAALTGPAFVRCDVPWPAAFLAGRCHIEYRRRGGTRARTLPDFFIRAHATVLGMRLLTRNRTKYRTYLPTIELIAPVTGR
jgi:predicted nucleic acid-binding protein